MQTVIGNNCADKCLVSTFLFDQKSISELIYCSYQINYLSDTEGRSQSLFVKLIQICNLPYLHPQLFKIL